MTFLAYTLDKWRKKIFLLREVANVYFSLCGRWLFKLFCSTQDKKKNECPRSMFIKLADQQYLLLQWISLMFCCCSGGKREIVVWFVCFYNMINHQLLIFRDQTKCTSSWNLQDKLRNNIQPINQWLWFAISTRINECQRGPVLNDNVKN